jgi:hypothetical protein
LYKLAPLTMSVPKGIEDGHKQQRGI